MTNANKPKIIYHYTTKEGLIGIFKNKSLWMTKIHYLNDASELTRPLSMARDFLKSILTEMGKKTLNVSNNNKGINKMIGDIEEWENINLCVASFCTNGNLLSQWRGYGTFGSAYSIGFDVEEIEKSLPKNDFELSPCKYYTNQEYEEEIKRFILITMEESGKNKNATENFVGRLIRKAALMKLDCFREEDEWRIVSWMPRSYSAKEFNFRAGKSMLIPFYELSLNPLSIMEVIVGPTQHSDLTKSAIMGMSYKFGIENISKNEKNVKISGIPFRVF